MTAVQLSNAKLTLSAVALQHNVQIVKTLAPTSRILAMVKANAYGHGLVPVATSLAPDVDAFAVANLAEAQMLRQALPQANILLLDGVYSEREMTLAITLNLWLVVHQAEQTQWLTHAQCPPSYGTKIWFKIDTGMHRLGMHHDMKIPQWFEQCRQLPWVEEVILMSHFANADEPDHPDNFKQWQRFQHLHSKLEQYSGQPVATSMCNSAGIISHDYAHGDWVRPGIMLYGTDPVAFSTERRPLDLHLVSALQGRVLGIRHIKAGETVGYGSSYTAEHKQIIVTIGLGYGDGIPRELPENIPCQLVLDDTVFQGKIVGRVSMDLITVTFDASMANHSDDHINHPWLGKWVKLWGWPNSLSALANALNTIPYTLTTQLTHRVERILM